jgi:hypothetical protein
VPVVRNDAGIAPWLAAIEDSQSALFMTGPLTSVK